MGTWRWIVIATMVWAGCDEPALGVITSNEVVVAEQAGLYSFDTDIDYGRALARDTDVLVVGSPRDDVAIATVRSGVALVRYRNLGGADAWGVVKELHASDAAPYDCFGRAVAIAGDVIAVGAKCRATSTGAVYVFVRDAGGADNWGEVAKLTAADGQTYDRFGRSIAIAGDVVAVGAPGYDERLICIGGSCPARPGSVYLFGRNVGGANAFGAIKKLQASDANPNESYGDQFGIATTFAGDVLAVGAEGKISLRGAVYLFERNTGGADNWGEIKKVVTGLTSSHCLGGSVALTATTLAAGAPCESTSATTAGAAYVFGRDQGGAGTWGLVKRVVGATTDANDALGDTVALAGDRLLVGAPLAGTTTGGAFYVFERAVGGADNWGEVRRAELAVPVVGDDFGTALWSDGSVALVAAPRRDDAARDAGGIYTFARDQGGTDNWGTVGAGILPPTATSLAQQAGHFGSSVAAAGDWMIVGAYADRFVGNNAGAAMVFGRDVGGAGAWGAAAKLTPPPGTDQFAGWSVAISGTTVVVGGYLVGGGVGGAFVYQPDGAGVWRLIKQLGPSDAVPNGWYGISVDIDGDTIVVGAPGRSTAGVAGGAYVYERDLGGANTWGERTKLLASDALVQDEVGRGVAIDGDTIVVGAASHDHGGFTNPGAAYVFERGAGGANTWGQTTKLVAPDAVSYQSYGGDVDIDGSVIVIGAKDSIFNGPERMQTYLYGRDVGGAAAWGLIRKLEDADTAPADGAGNDVAIAGDLIVVGAPRGPTSTGAGAFYVFAKDQGGVDNWGVLAKHQASDTIGGDALGKSVAIAGSFVFAGAPDKDYATYYDAGKAYVFRVADPCLPNPCLNGGTCATAADEAVCTCAAEYAGATCTDDVDECAAGTASCDPNATCANTAPGFSCTCNEGFTGDGVACAPIDETLPPIPADGGCCEAGARPAGGSLVLGLVVVASLRRRRRPTAS